jgi:hypothetical protein
MCKGWLAMARWRTVPTLAFTLAAAELAIALAPSPIRVVAGLTLVLLSGLVTTRVIQARLPLGRAERLVIVPALSLALTVVAGLLLNAAELRLTRASWAVALGLVTAAGLLAMTMLEEGHQVGRGTPNVRATPPAMWNGGPRTLPIGPSSMFAMALLAVGAAIVIGVLGGRASDSKAQFTELWALPGARSAPAVRLGMRSHQRGDTRYTIRVAIEGRVVRSQAVTLRPGQTWFGMQAVPRAGERVDVALLTSRQGRVYRQVHVTSTSS